MNEAGRILLEALLALLLFLGVICLFPEQMKAIRRLSWHEERINKRTACQEYFPLESRLRILPLSGTPSPPLSRECESIVPKTPIPLVEFGEDGFTLLETLVGILLCSLIFSGVFLSFQQSVFAGRSLRQDYQERAVLERASLLIRGYGESSLRYPSLPGLLVESGEGTLHRLLRAHSSTPAPASQGILAIRELSPEAVLTRSPGDRIFCEQGFGLPTNSKPVGLGSESEFVLITLEGNVDVVATPKKAAAKCPRGWELSSAFTLQPLQFSDSSSLRPPTLHSVIGALPIEDSVLIFLDAHGALRHFSILTHSNQVFAEPLAEFSLLVHTSEVSNQIEVRLRGRQSNHAASFLIPLPSPKLSALDLVL